MVRTLWYNYEARRKLINAISAAALSTGIIVSFYSEGSFGTWCGAWLFILGVLGICSKEDITSCQALMRYYIVQNVGRRIWLIGLVFCHLMMSSLSNIAVILILSGIFIKLGVFPFSFWVGSVMRDLNWGGRFLVRSLSKVATLIALCRATVLQNPSFTAVVIRLIITLAYATGLGIGSQHWGTIFGYSSLIQITPLVVLAYIKKEVAILVYLIIYSIMVGLCIVHINRVSIFSQGDMLKADITYAVYLWIWRLCGIPPRIGFFLKCYFILSSLSECFLLVCCYVFFSVASWVFYLWETISMLMVEKSFNMIKSKKGRWVSPIVVSILIITALPLTLVCISFV